MNKPIIKRLVNDILAYINPTLTTPITHIPNYFTAFDSNKCHNHELPKGAEKLEGFNRMAGIMGMVPLALCAWVAQLLRKPEAPKDWTGQMAGITLRVAQGAEKIYKEREGGTGQR